MSLTGILLGVINVLIVVAILVLVGLIIEWILGALGFPVPGQIRKVYLAIVALIALYLLLALLLGLPGVRVIGFHGSPVAGGAAAAISAAAAADDHA